MTSTTSPKVLVPLATLLAAGAVAIGSGATWTSSTGTQLSVTSGSLLHTNSRDGLTLTVTDLKPGDTLSGSLEIENVGSLDSLLTMAETDSSSTFSPGGLTLVILQGTTELYRGDFGGLDAAAIDLGELDPGQTTDVTFTVSMPVSDTANQGRTAGATYTFVTTQLPGSPLLENWL